MFRYVVLGLLRSGTALHGYALRKLYAERSGMTIGAGAFYRQLKQLAGAGLVRAAPNGEHEDPRRAPYVVTPRGAQAFDAWLRASASCVPTASIADELSLRIVFLPGLDPVVARDAFTAWHDSLWDANKRLEQRRRLALATGASTTAQGFPVAAMLLKRQANRIAAELQFLDDLRPAYEAWAAAQESASCSDATRLARRRNAGRPGR